MSNTLTPLVPFVVDAFQKVLRQTGATLGAINTDIDVEAVGKDQVINIPKSAVGSSYTVTPGPTPPSLVDKTITNSTLTLDQYKGERFHVTAEDWKKMGSRGTDFRMKQIEESISTLINGASSYIHGLAADAGAYALGTAGTAPFGSSADDLAELAFFLDTNLAPDSDRSLILNPRAFRNLFKLDGFQRFNEAPEGSSFASGTVRDLQGLMVGYDQGVATHTAGTGAGYLLSAAVDIGDTTISVDTGSGTILAGDVISFAGGTYKYVVKTALGGGTFVLTSPSLEAASDNAAVTVQADSARNLAMHRDAIFAGFRPPAEAPGGDLASKLGGVEIVTDPVTGLSLRLAEYPGYHANAYEVSILYGATVVRPELLMPLLG